MSRAGRVDGFWENWLSPWDIAAGILLVREAGGFVSDKRRRAGHAGHRRHRRRQRGHPPRTARHAEEADPVGSGTASASKPHGGIHAFPASRRRRQPGWKPQGFTIIAERRRRLRLS
jgi:hypothetical protein